ncbi:Nucleotide-binding alpha-beta plait-containing protein [Penicillium alfredii]|uniref:Nucleotide-binding alpha-beta plait-containing protein n=1 Tax=Penicillium alfredii TaxID=1506179 RepID=A0A9W9KRE8_9EURO|nr:Nucleotide-binding alpha-beta plait-containing protein [Penicillium alfredii]KAJ5115455.1 Nucleotide-binding alpha-beta plait-containing protein [Penicillium alfredii]
MPFLGREKGRSPRSRRSDDEFVVFLQGIPAHCRWQELKDLVRQTAQHIRQAVVYDDNHGFPTGLGQIIVKDEDEAWRTYHRLSTNGWEGQSLVVTLARTSAPTKPIAGPTRSPPAMMPSGYMAGHSTPPRVQGNMAMPPSPISPEYETIILLSLTKLIVFIRSVHPASPTYAYPEYGPMMGAMSMPQQFMPMMPDPLAQPVQCFSPSPLMHCSVYDGTSWNMLPSYPVSPMHPLHEAREDDDSPDTSPRYHPHKSRASHTDPSSPTYSLVWRTVRIQNLHTATTSADLKTLLQGAGNVEQCQIVGTSDAHSPQDQTHGSATLHSADEARRAVSMFNNMTFMGSRIRVKLDGSAHAARGGSWDGKLAAQADDPDPLDLSLSDELSDSSEERYTPVKRVVDPFQPLVVDGSGLANMSVDLLSTSAPT